MISMRLGDEEWMATGLLEAFAEVMGRKGKI